MELNFESAIVTHCAPTLAGIKTANLFQFRQAPIAAVRREVRHWDEKLSRQGIRVKILKRCRAFDSCLIYVYRPGQLQRIISSPNTRAFLKGLGYIDENPTLILAQLSRRLCMSVEFPHEIGVFLGYPLDDVIGFIKNGGRNYTLSGYWKAYGNPEQAQAYFDLCRRCTESYCRHYEQGVSLLNLAVAA